MLVRRQGLTVSVLCLCLLAFLALAMRAATGGALHLDVSLALRVQDLPDVLDRLFAFENWLGDGLPLICVTLAAAAVLWVRGYRLEAGCFVLTFLIRASDVIVKHSVSEPRPSASLINVSFPHDDLSFPSGHVIGVTLVFGLLLAWAPKPVTDARAAIALRVVCGAYIATIGLARIWVGAHWPSDVLAGYLYAALFLVPVLLVTAARSSAERSVGPASLD